MLSDPWLRRLERWRTIAIRLRLPKPVAQWLGTAYQRYRRRAIGPAALAGSPFRDVVHLRDAATRATGLLEHRVLGTSHVFVATEPRHRDFLRHVYNYPGNRQRFEPPFVTRLGRGLLHVPTGAAATVDRMLISESVRGKFEWALGMLPPLTDPVRVAGAATTILGNVSSNYFHWLIECLPRLHVLDAARLASPPVLLVPETLAPFQRSTIEWCAPKGVEVRYVADEWMQPDELVFPSLAAEPAIGYLRKDAATYLRRCIFDHTGVVAAGRRRRLYIPRAMAGQRRRIVNEDEVIARLTARGFEVVHPERLTFEEQVRLFQSAEVVVGSRGAALTNILFGTRLKVLELTARIPFAGAVYFSLAVSLGHEYHHLFTRRLDANFDVNLAALDQALEAMALTP